MSLRVEISYAQEVGGTIQIPEVNVTAPAPTTPVSGDPGGFATTPQYHTEKANLGPLGDQSILKTPYSVTVVPEDLLVNQQVQTVNDSLRYLPSVEIRDQQGYEVSRPQSLGFMGSIVQNTRLDGLNIIGTTAIATENLAGVEVLNGLAGSLYGPETPAGVFNYILKRPTGAPLFSYTEGYDSTGVFTEHVDVGGTVGQDGQIGYRFNVVHGEGSSYAPDSNINRTLISADVDFHIDSQTVIETDFSHYSTSATGLPGGIQYATPGTKSTVLPAAVNPDTLGYGQPGAGPELTTDTGLVKIKHSFNDQWNVEVGGLYQNAVRGLYGITNELTDNSGNYNVVKNFTAVPHFTIGSWMATLNGHFDLFGLKNDVSIGANGFENGQYSYRNNIAQTLGSASLANPVVFPSSPVPNTGGEYESASLSQENIITGDTIHFNSKLALQAVLSTSFFDGQSFNTSGKTTSSEVRNGALSPTVSLIYTPSSRLTAYATFAETEEQGDQAPSTAANANQFMGPYHDTEYDVGAKYAVSNDLLVSLDAFRMTRPLAEADLTSNIFSVVGTQRDAGVELFVQGNLLRDLTVLGGVTYIDARLWGTGNPTTNDMLVVGVPNWKADLAFDYHPGFAYGFALTGAVHHEGTRAAMNTNTSFAPAYTTLDLGVRYVLPDFQKHKTTLRFQVNNLTNVYYYSSIEDGTTGNLAGSTGADTAYLGAPRTFMASLEFDY
ncbi:TonB-dependent receptor [Pararobbsia alpina]|uniref:Ferrichrome receptor FcuA n=1 Tax=Pararobbsia alpina TaxID=621374 RepID=A0A6S7BAC4_9BURK|nr:TonB-dependent receptor [Pararobbsia alpina]CAB3793300.1 Ferrichrome receptor FcuA [Pararobbsia alpina]